MTYKKHILGFAGLIFCLLALTSQAAAHRNDALAAKSRSAKSPYMRIYGPSLPPYGYVQFCDNNPQECRERKGSHRRPQLTPARLLELDEINRLVNDAIEPATDQEAYGVSEYWTLPRTKGDCEDYALLKRRMLMARGWSPSALLLTVVRDERGDGHAVLTIRTAKGDYILDNKTPEILAWSHTPYKYVMRQSYLNPQNWMRLDKYDNQKQVRRSGSRR